MAKRFSVVIATYNRKELLLQAIDSVISQTYKDYEVVIADDGSTDGTVELIKERYGESVRLVRQGNQGSECAYKLGVSIAEGDYIAFLDSDDVFFPHTLETYDLIIRKFESPPVILRAMAYFKDSDKVPSPAGNVDTLEVIKCKNYLSKSITLGLAQSRIVMKRELFNEVNRPRFDQIGPYKLNDYRLMLLVGAYGPCIITVSPITVGYRQHDAQASKTIEKMSEGVLELIAQVHGSVGTGKQTSRFLRYAFLGGPIVEWAKKSSRAGKRRLAFKLLFKGFPMIIAAALRWLIQSREDSNTPIRIGRSIH